MLTNTNLHKANVIKNIFFKKSRKSLDFFFLLYDIIITVKGNNKEKR